MKDLDSLRDLLKYKGVAQADGTAFVLLRKNPEAVELYSLARKTMFANFDLADQQPRTVNGVPVEHIDFKLPACPFVDDRYDSAVVKQAGLIAEDLKMSKAETDEVAESAATLSAALDDDENTLDWLAALIVPVGRLATYFKTKGKRLFELCKEHSTISRVILVSVGISVGFCVAYLFYGDVIKKAVLPSKKVDPVIVALQDPTPTLKYQEMVVDEKKPEIAVPAAVVAAATTINTTVNNAPAFVADKTKLGLARARTAFLGLHDWLKTPVFEVVDGVRYRFASVVVNNEVKKGFFQYDDWKDKEDGFPDDAMDYLAMDQGEFDDVAYFGKGGRRQNKHRKGHWVPGVQNPADARPIVLGAGLVSWADDAEDEADFKRRMNEGSNTAKDPVTLPSHIDANLAKDYLRLRSLYLVWEKANCDHWPANMKKLVCPLVPKDEKHAKQLLMLMNTRMNYEENKALGKFPPKKAVPKTPAKKEEKKTEARVNPDSPADFDPFYNHLMEVCIVRNKLSKDLTTFNFAPDDKDLLWLGNCVGYTHEGKTVVLTAAHCVDPAEIEKAGYVVDVNGVKTKYDYVVIRRMVETGGPAFAPYLVSTKDFKQISVAGKPVDIAYTLNCKVPTIKSSSVCPAVTFVKNQNGVRLSLRAGKRSLTLFDKLKGDDKEFVHVQYNGNSLNGDSGCLVVDKSGKPIGIHTCAVKVGTKETHNLCVSFMHINPAIKNGDGVPLN